MAAMTREIRIDDLAAPVLGDAQRMALATASRRLRCSPSTPSARRRSRAPDSTTSAPAISASGSALQLAEMDTDPERTGLGRLMLFNDSVRGAANRLLIRDLLKRHPEILDVPIERPVIVVGLPRSGTTHLVNLLAADTRFRSLPLWESYEPVPNPADHAEVDAVDPRWVRCNRRGRPCRARRLSSRPCTPWSPITCTRRSS
jgi:hypothetical protein